MLPHQFLLKPLAIACVLASATSAFAVDEAFTLGTVTVAGSRARVGEMPQDQAGTLVTRRDMLRFGRDTVGDAVNLLPGVTLSNNSRNELLLSLIHI